MIETNKFEFLTKLNQQTHSFEIYLDNSNGESDTAKYAINPNSIVSLIIETDLSSWVTSGSLSFYFDPAAYISGINDSTGQDSRHTTSLTTKEVNPSVFKGKDSSKINPSQKGSFIFRNDGKDVLRVKIHPLSNNTSNLNNSGSTKYAGYTIDGKDKFWVLSYVFSVTDMEDIDMAPGSSGASSSNLKCLKLYFTDLRFQTLNTELLEYSTSQSNLASRATLLEKDHSIPTGLAIKEVLNKSLAKLTTAYIDKQITGEEETEWEDGATSIFYTNPAQATAHDCLSYLYKYHSSNKKGAYTSLGRSPRGGGSTSSINDLSLLTIERGPIAAATGYFTLRPVSWFFSQAGKTEEEPGNYQIEHFFLQGYSGEKDGSIAYKSRRAPLTNKDVKKDIKTSQHNFITNYRFVDVSPYINSNVFCTRPVYSFNASRRSFNVEFESHNVQKARQFISQQYIQGVYKNLQTDLEDLFLITLDKDKRDLALVPTYSLYGEDPILRQCDGIKKLLYTGLFQNACINFRAPGLTSRQIGRFVAIDRTEGVESTPFNDKFYGQWFIISLKHIFQGELYYNDITAIKVHRFNKLPDEFLGTIDNFS